MEFWNIVDVELTILKFNTSFKPVTVILCKAKTLLTLIDMCAYLRLNSFMYKYLLIN